MKRKSWFGWAAVAAAVLLSIFFVYQWLSPDPASPLSPADSPPPASEEGHDRIKIGFANLTDDVLFPQKVKQSIEAEAKKHGVELVTADNRLDGATALKNAEKFIAEGVDLVIEFQTDERYGNIIMDRLRVANIPVIAVDIPMPGAIFFGADNYRAGYMAGTALGKAVQERWQGRIDKLFMLELPQSGPIPAARLQGQRDGLESVIGKVPEDKTVHLNSKNTFEESSRLVEKELRSLPPETRMAFININDDTALGSLHAIEQADRSDWALIVGQNGTAPALAELLKGQSSLIGTTAYYPERYGEKIIPAAIKLLKGEQVPPYLFTDHVFIDRNNAMDYETAK